jgi:hypothetical protein
MDECNRHASLAAVLAKTRTEIAGARLWLPIRGRRVLVVANNAARIRRALEAA